MEHNVPKIQSDVTVDSGKKVKESTGRAGQ